MTTCENCGADEFTCAGCGVLQKPDDFPCSIEGCKKPRHGRSLCAQHACRCAIPDDPSCPVHGGRPTSQVAPSSSQPGSSDMDIPQAAIEAGAQSLFADEHGFIQPDHPWLTTFEVAVRGRYTWRSTEVLTAAFPHLRPLFQQATRVGYELGRREAKIEHAGMLEARASGEGLSTATRGVLRGLASTIARDLTKGDPK